MPWPPQYQIILSGTPFASIILALIIDCSSGKIGSGMPWISSVGTVTFWASVPGPALSTNDCANPGTSPVSAPINMPGARAGLILAPVTMKFSRSSSAYDVRTAPS